MRIITKISAAVFIIYLILSFSITAYAAPDGVEKAMDSVAIIYNASDGSYGSAFAIGKEGEAPVYFITNHHCVTDIAGKVVNEVSLICGMQSGQTYKATVVFSKSEYDYAILKAESPVTEKIPLKLLDGELETGNEVWALGYPDEASWDDRLNGIKSDVVSTQGKITNLSYDYDIFEYEIDENGNKKIKCDEFGSPKYSRHVKDVYESNLHIAPGNSGGPLVTSGGFAAGINVAIRYDGDEKVACAIKIKYVMEALDNNGIEYEAVASDAITSISDEDNDSSSAEEQKPLSALSVALLIIGTLIVVGIICFFVIGRFTTKNKTKVSAAVPSDGLTRRRVVTPPKVQIILDKTAYPMQEGREYIIGKNAHECSITIEKETENIAPRHCSVKFENGSLHIRKIADSSYNITMCKEKPDKHYDKKEMGSEEVSIKESDFSKYIFYLGNRKHVITVKKKED